MSIKRTIIAAVVGLTLVALVAPGVAQGVTIEELLAQIATLQAQLVALQGGSSAGTGTGACAGVTFTRNLTVGSTGSDVKCMQVLLNNNGYTVATTGAGSPGAETSYFGPKTLVAVRAFQAAKGWTPANQVGPLTRGALNALLGTSGGSNPPVVIPTGAGLAVQLAYDNPASGTLVSGATATDGQGAADLAHFTFVNGDNATVNVTSLKFNRIGISQDTLLNNVYLYQGASRLTDAATVAAGVITFTGAPLFTVPAGGSITIRVVADIYYGLSGQTVGVSVPTSASVGTNASSVRGTFPVSSNLHTTASATLATASFNSTTYPYTSGSSATTVDPQNDYEVWRNLVSIGTRAVNLKSFALLQTGSAPASAIQNYRLYVDGVQVGSAVASADANGYVTFDLSSSPVALQTGSRTFKVLADIISGSSLTFSYSLRNSADAVFTDSQIGVGLTPLANSTTFTQRRSCNYNTSSYGCSINSGAITFAKATDSPAGNLVLSAPGATLAKYTLTAAGEPVKISDLYVCISDATTSPAYFRNGALFANGVQIGSTANIKSTGTAACSTSTSNANSTHFSLGSALIVNPGTPVTLEVRADVTDANGATVANGDSVFAVITAGSANATGQTSKNSISTPASGVAGNTLAVSRGALTLSKYTAYTDQNAVAPLTNYKLAHFTVTSSTTENININSITVDLDDVSSYTTNLYVKLGNNTLTTKSTVSAANSWATNYTIQPGQTVDLLVYTDVSSGMTGGTGVASVYINGTTSSSGVSVCADSQVTCTVGSENDLDGQTITFTSGSWASALDGTSPQIQAVAGGKTVPVARYKFTASNDSYTVTDLLFTVGNPAAAATSAVINSLTVKDGVNSVTVPYDSVNARFTLSSSAGLVTVPANTSKILTVELNLVTPYTNGTTSSGTSTAPTINTTGKNVAVTLTYIAKRNSQGATSNTSPSTQSNAMYVYKTVPTFTVGSLSGQGVLLQAGSSASIYSFTVKADDAGPVALKQLKFPITITDASGGGTETLGTFKFFRGTYDMTANSQATIVNTSGDTLEATNTIGEGTTTVVVIFDTEETIPAGSTYTYYLKATGSTFVSNSTGADSVSTYLAGDTQATSASVVNAQTKFFLDAAATAGLQKLHTTASAGVSGTAYNIIWSDKSANNHDYTYDSTSSDWFNGFPMQSSNLDALGVVAGL